ncbi:hypothetical protein [Mycobacterium sp. SMC-4]|uniref:hypothetical protein n=1 Tax=Mycobacterium sp. SMC-4 TaxID=2857059 RepID=UPI0021B20FA7|nr:hypothetical protein [Mycobacterium sp. SMC-4]UXA17261.1 hypothetical protein KXD98_21350 [Mycobacterium sp. SMC-4]
MKPADGQNEGKADKNSQVDPKAPQNQCQGQNGQPGQPCTAGPHGQQAPTVNIERFVQAEDRNGMQGCNDLAYATQAAQMNPGYAPMSKGRNSQRVPALHIARKVVNGTARQRVREGNA